MLKHLLIKNYTLIDTLEISPSNRLNVITGETGAGKSIMLGAVGLLLGYRADSKALLNPEKKCIVEGVFDISQYNLQWIFDRMDYDYEKECIIRREIIPSGKSRAFINDTPTTLDVLKEIGLKLMDIHSQNDTLLLGSNPYQLELLDIYAANQKLLKKYQESFSKFQKAELAYNTLIRESNEINKESDYNNFLLDELVKADLQSGEQQELEENLTLLEHAEEIKASLFELMERLNNSEQSTQSGLQHSVKILSNISRYNQQLEELKERVESCRIEIKDITDSLEEIDRTVEFDPIKIQDNQGRLSLIYSLQQKHLVNSIEALLLIKSNLETKSERILNFDREIETAQKELNEACEEMMLAASKLTESRKMAAGPFAESIMKELRFLGMEDSRMEINLIEMNPGANGSDQIELLFSANKGIAPQPLKNVASGGEFSRLMFCIKYLIAGKTALPTVVFDEIDTGISGEVALKMVNMMEKMSKNHQVITISHLPQFAAKGETHFYVYKDNSAEKTTSRVRQLAGDERVVEIAKMIGGNNPSEVAYQNAQELMN